MAGYTQRMLSVDEAATYLQISVRRMRRLIAAGEIPVVALGPRLRRISPSALEAWAARRETERSDPSQS